MNTINESPSLMDRVMADPKRKERIEREYQKLLISELMLELMEDEGTSVRSLAEKSGVARSIIQDLRSGTRDNPTVRNFSRLLHALGAEIVIRKGRKVLAKV